MHSHTVQVAREVYEGQERKWWSLWKRMKLEEEKHDPSTKCLNL